MIVQCANCGTKFNLDQSALPDEGAWVRCSKCQEVFQVGGPEPAAEPARQAPAEQPEEARDHIRLDLEGAGSEREQRAEELADFGLMMEGDEPEETGGKGPGGFFKVLFWIIAIVVLLAVAGTGALVAMDRLGVAPSLVQRFRGVPVLASFLGAGTKGMGEAEAPDEINMALSNVRGYYRNNAKAGRLFIIQGLVENHHGKDRMEVLVRGRLRDKNGKVARQAVVYAGVVFTPEELKELSLKELQARLGDAKGPDGSPYVVKPGGTIPFMIVFADLPSNLAEFTAEVVGSAPMAPKPAAR